MTLSVAEKTNAFSADDNGACSNGRGIKDKCGSGKRTRGRTGYRGSSEIGPLCYGGR